MQSSKLTQYKFKLIFLFLFSSLFFILGFIEQENNGMTIGLVGFIMLQFVAVDYKLVKLYCNVLEERREFANKLILERKNIFILMLVAAITVYLTQFFLIKEFGTLEAVMLKYGIIYQKISEGEKWRLLIGYLFHSDISHWLINTSLLIGYCTLARPYSIRFIFSIFFLGCVLSSIGAYFLYMLGFSNNDGFLGVSGGVAAISGAVLVATIKFKNNFPKYFHVSFMSFTGSIICIDFITTPLMTALSHLIGFLSGFLFSLVYLKLSKMISKENL